MKQFSLSFEAFPPLTYTPLVMHCRWCTEGDALQVMHCRWCTAGDAPLVMHYRWCTAGDAGGALFHSFSSFHCFSSFFIVFHCFSLFFIVLFYHFPYFSIVFHPVSTFFIYLYCSSPFRPCFSWFFMVLHGSLYLIIYFIEGNLILTYIDSLKMSPKLVNNKSPKKVEILVNQQNFL